MLEKLECSAAMANPRHSVELRNEMLSRSAEKLEALCGVRLKSCKDLLCGASNRLAALDPDSVLKRGYSVVTDTDGRIIHTANELSEGKDVLIRMTGGRASAKVSGIELEG
jgi:exodeoxyribonuclease VII large subunit